LSRPNTAHFVLSAGRSGSTLLSNMLRLHPDVLSLSEFFSVLEVQSLFAQSSVTGLRLWETLGHISSDVAKILQHARLPEILLNLQSNHGLDELRALSPLALVTAPHLTNAVDPLIREIEAVVCSRGEAPVSEHLDGLFEWLRGRFARVVWVERSGGSIEYAEQLSELWPHAKHIHLLRDGRDCACSMALHSFFRVRVARLVQRDPGLSVERCLELPLAPSRFGAYWSSLMIRAQHVFEHTESSNRILLDYNNLVAEPVTALSRVANLMGVRCEADWLRQAASLARPSHSRWRDLPVGEQARLERACRPGLRILDRLLHRASM
jgi:hypothetical protein